jgi:uncharacterized protein (TIGR02266 family)
MDDAENGGGAEQRSSSREAITLVVEYEGADDLLVDYTENLSSGGTFVNTTREFEPDTRIRLMLSFPGLLQPLAVDGTVRWSRPGGEDERGVGIEFDSGEARDTLDSLIERVRARDQTLVGRVVKVLVVEDNPHVAQLIRDGLHGTGRRRFGDKLAFNFSMASNGRDAIDMLEAEQFDALIIDIYLPILDGSQVIAHVRASEGLEGLPIIAVSAGGESAKKSALGAGADFFLDKPMRLRQVIETMRQLMDLD